MAEPAAPPAPPPARLAPVSRWARPAASPAAAGPWVIPFGLTLLLGAVGITRQAWRDEHATWWAATIPFDSFGRLMSQMDVVIAPYYLFMRLWIAVAGDSVIAMRLPSLIAMAAAAALTARLGTKMFSPNVGLTAGCLLAVVPSVSRYAAEARPYAFAMCFAVASVLALHSALNLPAAHRDTADRSGSRWPSFASQPNGPGRRHAFGGWLWVWLFVVLTGLSHLVALLILLAHVAMVHSAALPFKRGWKPWLLTTALALLPLSPLVWLGARQTGQVSWIDASLRSLVTLPQSLARSAATAGILAALALLALAGTAWSREISTLLVWAAGPPLVLFIVANDLFYYRYLLFTLPAWTLLAASAIRLIASNRQRLTAAALCLAVLALGARDHIGLRKSPLPGDQDYQAAAAYVRDHAGTADHVVFDGFTDQRERFGFAYEWRDTAPVPICPVLQTCAASRIWLVRNGQSPPPPGFAAVLTQPFPGLTITLLTRH